MKTTLTSLALLTLLAAGAAIAHEGHTKKPATTSAPAARATPLAESNRTRSRATTLRGELVDPQCWFMHDGQGAEHAACAVTCAKGGQTLALLEAGTGRIYTILARGHGKDPNHDLYKHVGKPVEVRGVVFERGASAAVLPQVVAAVR